jgi:hypothetical protein
VPEAPGVDVTRKRLGRAVLFVLQQDPVISDKLVRADIDTLLFAGRAMDFASRLQGFHRGATPELARQYARLAGLGDRELCQRALPLLKQADVIEYTVDANGSLIRIEEFVGVTGTVIDQAFRLLEALRPSEAEVAVLHSVEIAAWAPLTESQHLEQVARRGLPDHAAQQGLNLTLAMGINRRVRSPELNENVIYNPHVWGTGQVDIASFLRNLAPGERDALLNIFEQASARPGIALDQVTASSPMLAGARKVGLVQAATVKSSSGRNRTYVFSPLIQASDDRVGTTEALHLRKLFVAHIMFGHEQAFSVYGRINDPTVLVESLLRKERVGPATSIATDYHLLEAAGVVRVEPLEGNDRAFLRLLKREIVEGGLEWLQAGLGGMTPSGTVSGNQRQAAAAFVTPERDRATLPDEGATNEILFGAIFELRKEAQRAARSDSAFPLRS